MSLAKLSWSAASAFQVLALDAYSNFCLVLDKALLWDRPAGPLKIRALACFAEAVKKQRPHRSNNQQ
jgi:hypothetical protein